VIDPVDKAKTFDWVLVKIKTCYDKYKKYHEREDFEIMGAMHCLVSDANSYHKYIVSYKCDDKQGEIARQHNRILELEKEVAHLKNFMLLESISRLLNDNGITTTTYPEVDSNIRDDISIITIDIDQRIIRIILDDGMIMVVSQHYPSILIQLADPDCFDQLLDVIKKIRNHAAP